MQYIQIEFPLADEDSEALSDALTGVGALSVSFADRGDEPVLEPGPGEVRLWRDTLVCALFDDSISAPRRLQQVRGLLTPRVAADARVQIIEDRAWEREWLRYFRPMRFGDRLHVYPTDWPDPPPPEAVVVRLDPGLAFGTGSHATTALCLRMIDAIDWRGLTLIDYGCGSGILCIAALLLGAQSAVGVDIDPQALFALDDNARRNGISDKIIAQGVDVELTPADCVIANILAGPLIDLAPRLALVCRPGGTLILSGILDAQAQPVLDAYAPWFDAVQHCHEDGWSALRLTRH